MWVDWSGSYTVDESMSTVEGWAELVLSSVVARSVIESWVVGATVVEGDWLLSRTVVSEVGLRVVNCVVSNSLTVSVVSLGIVVACVDVCVVMISVVCSSNIIILGCSSRDYYCHYSYTPNCLILYCIVL